MVNVNGHLPIVPQGDVPPTQEPPPAQTGEFAGRSVKDLSDIAPSSLAVDTPFAFSSSPSSPPPLELTRFQRNAAAASASFGTEILPVSENTAWIEAHRVLGQEALRRLKSDGMLTTGRHHQSIPDDDYLKFVQGDLNYDLKKLYKTMKQLSSVLEDLKKKVIEKTKTNTATEDDLQLLQRVLDAKLAIEHHKELLFGVRQRLLNAENKELFNHLQSLVGTHLIPVDYKLSLVEFLLLPLISGEEHPHKKTTETFSEYLRVAKTVKKYALDCQTDVSQGSSEAIKLLNPLHPFFAIHLEGLAREGFIENFDDDSAMYHTANFIALNVWLLAKVGAYYNTQPVTDAIELALPSVPSPMESARVSSENARIIEGIRVEQLLAPYLMPSERPLAAEGLTTSDTYACKFKNEWATEHQGEGIMIRWKGRFALKKTDNTFENKEYHGEIDLTAMKGLTPKAEKAALSFVTTYCRATMDKRELLASQVDDLLRISPELRLAIHPNPDFWEWANNGSSATDPKADEYAAQMLQAQDNYRVLLYASKRFANEIDRAMVSIFVDQTQDLKFVKSCKYYEGEFELVDADNEASDEEDGQERTRTPSPPPPSISPISAGIQHVTTTIQDLISGTATHLSNAASATVSAIQVAFDAVVSVPSYIASALAPAGWVQAKFNIALRIIKENLEKNPKIRELIASMNASSSLALPVMSLLEPLSEATGAQGYEKFLHGLRGVLCSDDFQIELEKKKKNTEYDPLVDLVLEVCRVRFEEGYLYSFCDSLIKRILPESGDILSERDFKQIEQVSRSEKLSRFEVNAKKLQGHLNINFDPHLQGNIPFVLGTFHVDNKPVKLFRMGTPTMELGVGSTAQINPEFRGYVEDLALKGKKHLYISLQNDKKKVFYSGDESGRNSAIKKLQEDYPGSFFTAVLAQDSRFYKQVDSKGRPLGSEDTQLFKRVFYNQMMEENTGFYFPDQWKKDDDFQYGLQRLLEAVHHVAFEGREELTREEKLDFIEIYYSYLSIFLMKYSEADNVNITCKDAIDRAGKLNSLVLKLVMIIQGKGESRDHQRMHQVYTHAPAFLVKAQAIIHSRRERLETALARMNADEVSARIRANQLMGFTENEGGAFVEKLTAIIPIDPEGDILVPKDPSQVIP